MVYSEGFVVRTAFVVQIRVIRLGSWTRLADTQAEANPLDPPHSELSRYSI